MGNKSFGVIFDMDGVIADTNPHHEEAIKIFCERYGKTVSEEFMVDKIYGRTNADWIPELFGSLEDAQLNKYADEKEQLFRDLYASELKPVTGLKKFLKILKATDVKMAIATSAPKENADFILQGLNIEDYFDAILHSAHVTKGKPDPQIYLKASKALGLPPERCIVIEDSLSGVKAGLNAGCKVVGITTTHTEDE
ncbi:MAG: HAD family phosphatase [Fulvivirga sp.]